MKHASTLSAYARCARSASSGGKVSFRREGDAYVLSNGVISLRGEMCGEKLVRSVAARGRNFGSLDAIFKVALEDGWLTTGITSLCSISFSERAGVGVLDLIGEWWQVLGKWTIPGFAFRAHVRLTIRPGEPCFLAELVGVSNSGTKELRISNASFSALPSAENSEGGQSLLLRSGDDGAQSQPSCDIVLAPGQSATFQPPASAIVFAALGRK